MSDRHPYLRPICLALTIVLVAIALVEGFLLWEFIDDQQALGVDLSYYRGIAQRWLDTGTWYTERQLAGPYETQTLVDNLYPPPALYLFLPWVWLPFPLWWILPAVAIAYAIWRLRPAIWAWPILALIVALPKTIASILYGNSDLLVVTLVALGVVWGWPAVLVVFKPSMGLFALFGVWRRSWWAAAAVIAVLTLPQLPLWMHWPRVIANSTATFEYSLANYPFMALPVVAWIASTRRRGGALASSVIGPRSDVRTSAQ